MLFPVVDLTFPTGNKTADYYDFESDKSITLYNYNQLSDICNISDMVYLNRPINVGSGFKFPKIQNMNVIYDYRSSPSCKQTISTCGEKKRIQGCPVVMNFSFSTFNDKKTTQIKMGNFFKNIKNLRVRQVSSSPDASIFGMDCFPLKFLNDKDYYRNFIFDLKYNGNYDMTILGIPGGITDEDGCNSTDLIKDIYNALKPEVVVVNVPFCNNRTELVSIVSVIRGQLHINPNMVTISNRIINWSECDPKNNLYEIYQIRNMALIEDLTGFEFDEAEFYNLYDDNDINVMCTRILKLLNL